MLPAADLAPLLALLLRSVFDAAFPAALLVTLSLPLWASALPAALLADLLAFGFVSVLLALDATFFDVRSDMALLLVMMRLSPPSAVSVRPGPGTCLVCRRS